MTMIPPSQRHTLIELQFPPQVLFSVMKLQKSAKQRVSIIIASCALPIDAGFGRKDKQNELQW